jgi:hypothetical protein
MKRRRQPCIHEHESTRKSPRWTFVPSPYLDLLPEMRGEVQHHLVDLRDRMALARTCKQLLGDMPLPRLPLPWRPAWDTIRKQYPKEAMAFQYAFLEMIRVGVPTWPGVFRCAAIDLFACETARGCYSLSITWWWKEERDGFEDNMIVKWYPAEKTWRVGRSDVGGPSLSLDKVLEIRGDTWRAAVAQPRSETRSPPSTRTCNKLILHDFDEDTSM